MEVSQGAGGLRAEGEITDATGAPVAHRSVERSEPECVGLARAIGVWASLVLDAEVERAKAAPTPPPPPPVSEGWPAPAPPPEKPSPETELFLAHAPGERQIEIGAASFVMSGTGTGLLAGGSLFVVDEVAAGWFLRPALLAGGTVFQILPEDQAEATFGAVRFDACKRIPGNYLERRGIQVDLCAGPEAGVLNLQGGPAPATLPYLAAGPSVALRGELASDLSVMVGGAAELNILGQTADGGTVNPSLWIARVELGVSWRLR
jgi:hypothetical protein